MPLEILVECPHCRAVFESWASGLPVENMHAGTFVGNTQGCPSCGKSVPLDDMYISDGTVDLPRPVTTFAMGKGLIEALRKASNPRQTAQRLVRDIAAAETDADIQKIKAREGRLNQHIAKNLPSDATLARRYFLPIIVAFLLALQLAKPMKTAIEGMRKHQPRGDLASPTAVTPVVRQECKTADEAAAHLLIVVKQMQNAGVRPQQVRNILVQLFFDLESCSSGKDLEKLRASLTAQTAELSPWIPQKPADLYHYLAAIGAVIGIVKWVKSSKKEEPEKGDDREDLNKRVGEEMGRITRELEQLRNQHRNAPAKQSNASETKTKDKKGKRRKPKRRH